MKKHFVVFMSPGSFVAEQTEKLIASWDVDRAMQMASQITERYGATPYGFYFITKGRTAKDLDSKKIKESNMYFLGGKVMTLADAKALNDPKNSILISNMENNDYERVIQNDNSWRITLPLRKGDVVLDYTPPKKEALS